eukprot:1144794-Pelagomonas_calceolata.AAC.1
MAQPGILGHSLLATFFFCHGSCASAILLLQQEFLIFSLPLGRCSRISATRTSYSALRQVVPN